MLSQHAMHNQALLACSWPIRGQGGQIHYPSMQQKPITCWESYTCYPSIHSADTLSQHALQNLNCIKEAAKAQNSGQADTVK